MYTIIHDDDRAYNALNCIPIVRTVCQLKTQSSPNVVGAQTCDSSGSRIANGSERKWLQEPEKWWRVRYSNLGAEILVSLWKFLRATEVEKIHVRHVLSP